MSDTPFLLAPAQLEDAAALALDRAKISGAADATAEVIESTQLSVGVRLGEIETLQHRRSKQLRISVIVDGRRAESMTSELTPDAIESAIEAACAIARHVAPDESAGLVDAAFLARDIPDLDLFHIWLPSAEDALEIARRIETAALDGEDLPAGTAIKAEGARASAFHRQLCFATSRGFMASYPSSSHYYDCGVIAERNGRMQVANWSRTARAIDDLPAPDTIGRAARARALAKLDARDIPTGDMPILFEGILAMALVDPVMGAISGEAQYLSDGFYTGKLGERIFADHVSIEERPLLPRGLASRAFDAEGVATVDRDLVHRGVLQSYALSRYSAQRLGLPLTGHAGGMSNLRLVGHNTRPSDTREAMLRKLGNGLLVTDIAGGGTERTTGDCSFAVTGQRVVNGEIAHAVEGVTIAGSLPDLMREIVAIGADEHVEQSITSGSILVGAMRVAGR